MADGQPDRQPDAKPDTPSDAQSGPPAVARPYPTVTPYLLYEDVAAALDWVHRAFGFTERLRFADDDGIVNHAEVVVEDGGVVMLGHPGPEYRNPRRSGAGSALVHVVVADVDAHHRRAANAGAEVLRPPEDQAYGDRRYDVLDLEGHLWSFAQPVRNVAPEEWGAQTAD
jgi:PhnB protein